MHRPWPLWMATVLTALVVAISASGCSGKQATASGAASATASPTALDWSAVDQVIGRPASQLDGGVHRYGLPRTDLTVHLGDVEASIDRDLTYVSYHSVNALNTLLEKLEEKYAQYVTNNRYLYWKINDVFPEVVSRTRFSDFY